MVDEHDIARLQEEHERMADKLRDTEDCAFNAFDDFLQVLGEVCWTVGIAVVVIVVLALTYAVRNVGVTIP